MFERRFGENTLPDTEVLPKLLTNYVYYCSESDGLYKLRALINIIKHISSSTYFDTITKYYLEEKFTDMIFGQAPVLTDLDVHRLHDSIAKLFLYLEEQIFLTEEPQELVALNEIYTIFSGIAFQYGY